MPVMTYLLWRELGPSCLISVGLIVIQPPFQYAVGRFHARLWYVAAIYCIDNDNIIILYSYIHYLYVTIQAEVSYSDRQESESDE